MSVHALPSAPKRKKAPSSTKPPKKPPIVCEAVPDMVFNLSKEQIDECLGLSRTMYINVVVDRIYQYKYRVFCTMLVETVIADINKINPFVGMFADNIHDTRVLLLEHMVCSQLKDVFSSDSVGSVTMYFSTAFSFTMM